MKTFKIAFFALLFMMTGAVNAAVVDYTFSGADSWASGNNDAVANVAFDTTWMIELTKELKTTIQFSNTFDETSIFGSGVTLTSLAVDGPATSWTSSISAPGGSVLFSAVLQAGTYALNMASPLGGMEEQGGSYSVGVLTAETPLPAAVWLFGSALMGLFGASRRKSTAVAA